MRIMVALNAWNIAEDRTFSLPVRRHAILYGAPAKVVTSFKTDAHYGRVERMEHCRRPDFFLTTSQIKNFDFPVSPTCA